MYNPLLPAPRRPLSCATFAGLGRRPREAVAGSRRWPAVFRYAQGSASGNLCRHSAQVVVVSVSRVLNRHPLFAERRGPLVESRCQRSGRNHPSSRWMVKPGDHALSIHPFQRAGPPPHVRTGSSVYQRGQRTHFQVSRLRASPVVRTEPVSALTHASMETPCSLLVSVSASLGLAGLQNSTPPAGLQIPLALPLRHGLPTPKENRHHQSHCHALASSWLFPFRPPASSLP